MPAELQPKIFLGDSTYKLAAGIYFKTKGVGKVVVEYNNPALTDLSSRKPALEQIRDEFFPGDGDM